MEDFQRGIEAAQDELRHPDCDLIALICSFDGDPADSAFQRGYLHMLLAANEEIGA